MKKYCIFASIIGFICFIAGIVIMCLSAGNGYDFNDIPFVDHNIYETEYTSTAVTVPLTATLDEEPTEIHRHDLSVAESKLITKIDIDASAANINFYSSYNDQIQISTSGRGSGSVDINFSSYSIDIDYGSSGFDFTDLSSIDLKSLGDIISDVPEIDIYLPESKELEDVSIELASGEVSVYYLNAKELDIEIASGRVNVHNCNIYENPDIALVAGNIHISSSYFNNLRIENASGGDIYISECELFGETRIDTVAGNTDIYYLKGDIDDYDFNIDVISGTVRINGENTIPSNSNAPNKISIDKVSGDCYIEFE